MDGKIVPFSGDKGAGSWGDLYRAIFDLQPAAPGRAAFLCIWLHADSPESAGRKAYAIVEQLPYSLGDPNPVVFAYPSVAADDSELPGFNAQSAANAELAKRFGLSLMWCVQTPE